MASFLILISHSYHQFYHLIQQSLVDNSTLQLTSLVCTLLLRHLSKQILRLFPSLSNQPNICSLLFDKARQERQPFIFNPLSRISHPHCCFHFLTSLLFVVTHACQVVSSLCMHGYSFMMYLSVLPHPYTLHYFVGFFLNFFGHIRGGCLRKLNNGFSHTSYSRAGKVIAPSHICSQCVLSFNPLLHSFIHILSHNCKLSFKKNCSSFALRIKKRKERKNENK